MTIECTELDRLHRFATEVSWPVPGGEVRCDPPGGTLSSWNCQVSASGPAPIVGPLIGGRRQERRIWTGLKHMRGEGHQ